jgi:hypothetical protein
MPVLQFVSLWQERLSAVQDVGCTYADSTLAFKLLGEKEMSTPTDSVV